jgi:hypothetical protein
MEEANIYCGIVQFHSQCVEESRDIICKLCNRKILLGVVVLHSLCDPKNDFSCYDCFIHYNQCVDPISGEDLDSEHMRHFALGDKGSGYMSNELIDSGRIHPSAIHCNPHIVLYYSKKNGSRTKSSSNAVNRVSGQGSLLV